MALDANGTVHAWDGEAWTVLWQDTGAAQLAVEDDGTVHLVNDDLHRWGDCP